MRMRCRPRGRTAPDARDPASLDGGERRRRVLDRGLVRARLVEQRPAAGPLLPATRCGVTGDRSIAITCWYTSARGGVKALVTALDEVEDVLRSARSTHRSIEVEIVANGTGLDLLHAGITPYAARVAAMRAEFPNLGLVACGQTLQRLREQGIAVELLPGTEVAPSALDQVVKRLQTGWVYVRA